MNCDCSRRGEQHRRTDDCAHYRWRVEAHERPNGEDSYEATVRLKERPGVVGYGWGDSAREAREAALVDLDEQT